MKLVLSEAEIREALLSYVNATFSTQFNQITFGSYTTIREATFEVVEPKAEEVRS